MRYSIEPSERRYVKGYGFLSFAKSISKNIGQKLVDSAEKSAADALKIASQRAIQKTAEGAGNLVGSKFANKIRRYSKKSPDRSIELNSNESNNEIPKKRYISPQERQKIIDELSLI